MYTSALPGLGAAYRYSREVENCDENLDLLEEELGQNPLFGLEEMLKGI